jgi:hypothetical protein
MTQTLARDGARRDETLRTYGLVGGVASLVGSICAVAIIAWPRQVDDDMFSYPFGETSFTLAQVFLAVQHVAMLPLFLALLAMERSHPSRALRVGAWISLVGMALLAVMELVAITASDATLTDSTGSTVGALYGIPTLLLGVGPIVAGIGARRVGLFDGPARSLLLALGIYVFVPLLPALVAPMIFGRIALGVWLLLFAWLGLEIARRSPRGMR